MHINKYRDIISIDRIIDIDVSIDVDLDIYE